MKEAEKKTKRAYRLTDEELCEMNRLLRRYRDYGAILLGFENYEALNKDGQIFVIDGGIIRQEWIGMRK